MKFHDFGDNPFVGLRPFKTEESLLFFGRDQQVNEVLKKLHQSHFVAVVGNSGCGKSSLIYAGVIPQLLAGFLVAERDRWLIPVMKPGTSPLVNLAKALLSTVTPNSTLKSIESFIEQMKIKGIDAIIQLFEDCFKEGDTNLLFLIDQFEEIFRFAMQSKDKESRGEASDFVSLILALAEQRKAPVYIILTMRSDFIGDCDNFYGLPWALNKSQYLVSRLTREQQKEVIVHPIVLFRQKISPRLVNRILSEEFIGKDPLPIMQHALMRTWEEWSNDGKKDIITIKHYEQAGTMKNALSLHADAAILGMNEKEQDLTKRIFQALSDTDESNRRIRRPARLGEIEKITGAGKKEILNILNRFKSHGRSFIIISQDKEKDNPLVDISHESLLRQWEQLKKWIDEEAEDKKRYLKLVESKQDFDKGEVTHLLDPQLQLALDWLDKKQPTKEWADRYHEGFPEIEDFIKTSDEKSKANKRAKKIRFIIFTASLVVLSLLAVIFGVTAYIERDKAETAQGVAEDAEKKMQIERDKADTARKDVEEVNKDLETALYNIIIAQQETEKEKKKTEFALFETEKAKTEAINTLAANDWMNGVNAIKLGDKIKASHYFARSGSITKDTLQARRSNYNAQFHTKSVLLKSIMQHNNGVRGATFSPDQQFILSWSEDGTARLWNVKDGSQVFTMQHDYSVYGATFSPDQQFILTWSRDFTARLWNGKDGSLVFSMEHDDDVSGASFSPDQQFILTWSWDYTARLWNVKDSSLAFTMQHNGFISGAMFSQDQQFILTWSGDFISQSVDNTARLWNVKDGSQVFIMKHDNSVDGGIFSPDQQFILTWGANNISLGADFIARLWNVKDGSQVFTMQHDYSVYGATFSPDQQFILTWSRDNTARLWNVKDGSLVFSMEHDDDVSGAIFSPDQQFILTWSRDNTARLWKVKDGSSVFSMQHNSYINGVMFCPDQQFILTWSKDNTSQIWNAKDGSKVFSLKHGSDVYGVTISPDQQFILTWSADGTAQLWNIKDGSQIYIMKHKDSLRGATFSPDQQFILTWSRYDIAKLWDISINTGYPPEHLPLLVEVRTGTKMDAYGDVSALSKEEWEERKKKYDQIIKSSQ